jgi:hypothetical protein
MSVVHTIPKELSCLCIWHGWRNMEVCAMHLRSGYGKFFDPKAQPTKRRATRW